MLQRKKETVNIWEYKVGNNANIATFVRLWKIRLPLFDELCVLAISVKSFRSILLHWGEQECRLVEWFSYSCVTDGIQIKFLPGDFAGKKFGTSYSFWNHGLGLKYIITITFHINCFFATNK